MRATKPKRSQNAKEEEERILCAATQALIQKHGGLFVATAVRETRVKDLRVWIITVKLRQPTGHEGYVGELLYDGDSFTFITEQAIIDNRVRMIAADPESIRKWDEYRASTLRPRLAHGRLGSLSVVCSKAHGRP